MLMQSWKVHLAYACNTVTMNNSSDSSSNVKQQESNEHFAGK